MVSIFFIAISPVHAAIKIVTNPSSAILNLTARIPDLCGKDDIMHIYAEVTYSGLLEEDDQIVCSLMKKDVKIASKAYNPLPHQSGMVTNVFTFGYAPKFDEGWWSNKEQLHIACEVIKDAQDPIKVETPVVNVKEDNGVIAALDNPNLDFEIHDEIEVESVETPYNDDKKDVQDSTCVKLYDTSSDAKTGFSTKVQGPGTLKFYVKSKGSYSIGVGKYITETTNKALSREYDSKTWHSESSLKIPYNETINLYWMIDYFPEDEIEKTVYFDQILYEPECPIIEFEKSSEIIDGSYTVSWKKVANSVINYEYIVEVSQNENFANSTEIYKGFGNKISISGKFSGSKDYYRVRAIYGYYPANNSDKPEYSEGEFEAGDWSQAILFEIKDPPIKTYTLTVNSTNGNIFKYPNKEFYNEGDSITLTALADSNFIFDHWEVDLDGSQNPEIIVINSNKNVTAVFSAITETISAPNYPSGPLDGKVDQYGGPQSLNRYNAKISSKYFLKIIKN